MIPTVLKKAVVGAVRRAHADIRIAAFLRALSVVGMISGLGSFIVGINPFLAVLLLPRASIEGPQLLKMAIVGVIVYAISLSYYNATGGRRDGMVRL